MTRWHIVSGEFPPDNGGVAHYTALVARELARQGDRVDVWSHGPVGSAEIDGYTVHREPEMFTPAGLVRLGRAWDDADTGATRRLLVQWVPHAYGKRSMNVSVARWLARRARTRGEALDLMFHEVSAPFGFDVRGSALAIVHRLMAALLLRAAARVFVATPRWAEVLRPCALGRRLEFAWLPVPSNIEPTPETSGSATESEGSRVIGHFGTFAGPVSALLAPALVRLMTTDAPAGHPPHALLIGAGSDTFANALIRQSPSLSNRVHATGALPEAMVSARLRECDVLLQPYPDGVTTRRGSMMAALAHGAAIVTTAGPSTESVWSESAAARLVPVGDADALVRVTRALLEHPDDRRALGERAARLYASRFALRHTIDALRAVED